MAVIRKKIMGPPGTGKTYRLVNHYLNKEINDLHTDPQKIAYVTFSRAAALDGAEKIQKVFPGVELLYVSTLHGIGTKELAINTKEKLLNGKKWKQFKNVFPIYSAVNFDTFINESGATIHQDKNLQVINYARAKLISLQEASIQLNYHQGSVDIFFVEQLERDIEYYKKSNVMYEFSDMIKLFVEEKKHLALDAIFLDEAQDLNPLQWDMFFYIESRCKRSYIAGDDDQTIYNFQGADSNIFIDLDGERDDQEKSYRVPKAVHRKALEILPYISKRVDKKWYPKDEEGELIENCYLEELDFNEGEWMILATTNKLLKDFSEHFYRKGLRIFGKGNTILPQKTLEAYRTWNKLNNGGLATVEETQNMWTYLNYNKNHIKYGYSSGKTLGSEEIISLDILKKKHGLLIEGDWQQLSFDEDVKKYIKSILKSGDDLSTDPRIELSTIHGAKGRERENIVLCMDYGTETQSTMLAQKAAEDPDSIHRLFFVGTTRAMKRLYILSPLTAHYYTIGGQII